MLSCLCLTNIHYYTCHFFSYILPTAAWKFTVFASQVVCFAAEMNNVNCVLSFYGHSCLFYLLAGPILGVCLKQWRWWTRPWGCGLGATPRGCRAPAHRPLAPVVPAPPEPATMAQTMPALLWRTRPAPTMLRKKTTGVFGALLYQSGKFQTYFDHFKHIFGIFTILLQVTITAVPTQVYDVYLTVLKGRSVWASRAHQEARTWRRPCAACQLASWTTPLSGLSLMWSANVNFMPWQQTVKRARAPAASWRQTTAWSRAQQHRRAPTTPTAAHGTPAAPQGDPGPTCLTACRSSNLWKVKVSARFCVLSVSWSWSQLKYVQSWWSIRMCW